MDITFLFHQYALAKIKSEQKRTTQKTQQICRVFCVVPPEYCFGKKQPSHWFYSYFRVWGCVLLFYKQVTCKLNPVKT